MRFIFEVIFECLLNFDFCALRAEKKNEGSRCQFPLRPLEIRESRLEGKTEVGRSPILDALLGALPLLHF